MRVDVDQLPNLTETLESIPTLFGRLIRLPGLSRRPRTLTGEPQDSPEFNFLVRHEHQRLLLEWLS